MTQEILLRDEPDYVKAVSIQKAFRQNQYGIFTLNRSGTNRLYRGLENSKNEGKEWVPNEWLITVENSQSHLVLKVEVCLHHPPAKLPKSRSDILTVVTFDSSAWKDHIKLQKKVKE